MKIIFWNLQNIGDSKLTRATNAVAQLNGLGNNGLQYIVNVVTGDDVWEDATSTVPADIFIIIELVAGGGAKGVNGTGSCLRVMNRLLPALRLAAPGQDYARVVPLLIARRESVGIIYSQDTLTYQSSAVLRNPNGYLQPRSPFVAKFTVDATGDPLSVIGIHGPTSKPTTGDYRDSVSFTNLLGTVDTINQTATNPKEDMLIGGDFNCDPDSYYMKNAGTKKRQKVLAFADLNHYDYGTTLETPTYTSLRQSVNNAFNPPRNYASQPYDNIVYTLPSEAEPPAVELIDLIGKAPTYGTNLVATFNVCRKMSDHMPVAVEY